MFGLSMTELMVIFLVALLLFGAKGIPEIARSFGKSLNAFKKGMRESEDELNATRKDQGADKIPGNEKKSPDSPES